MHAYYRRPKLEGCALANVGNSSSFSSFNNVLLLNFWQWMPFFTTVIYRLSWWYFINCHHCWDLGIRGTSPSKWLAILQMDPNIDWTSQDPRSAWNFWPKKGLKGLLATLRRAAFVGYWAEIRNSILLDCCSAPQSVSILPLFLNKILLRFFPKLIGVRRMLRRSAKLSGRWQQQQKGFQKISACLTTLWNSYLITIWEGLVLVFSLLRFKCRKTSRYLVKFFLK